MNKLKVIIVTLVNKAMLGDLHAIDLLQPMIANMEAQHEAAGKLSEELSVDDKEILEAYVERTKNIPQLAAR